jgi:hypothetical protein
MRRHTLIGERFLLAVPALRPVAALVRASHERWDGGGYPDGLAGEAIPLGARIIAVCDAFDAMVTDRPYRERALAGRGRRGAPVLRREPVRPRRGGGVPGRRRSSGIRPDGSDPARGAAILNVWLRRQKPPLFRRSSCLSRTPTRASAPTPSATA